MPPLFKRTPALNLVAYPGDAKTLLAWDLPEEQRRKNLAGFTIACRPPGKPEYFLYNRLQFAHPEQHAQDASEPANSSVNAPLHKFRWLHVPGSAHQGLKPTMGLYAYTVTPRYFDSNGSLQALDPSLGASVEVAVGGFATSTLRLAFTRGYAQSQAYVDHFGPKAVIVHPGTDLLYDTAEVAGKNKAGEQFTYAQEYEWLGFTARESIFALLDEVLADPALRLDVFAYDLNEPDVMKKLLELAKQGRVRVILDDAALHHHNSKHDEAKPKPKVGKPKPEDQFEELFKQQAKPPAAIQRGHFSRYSHDKVLVISDAGGAKKALTGSTNFSVSGLYINSNHILVFEDEKTARQYGELFDQAWKDEVKTRPFLASPLATARFSPAGVTPPREITFSPHPKEVATGLLDAIAARIAKENTKGSAIGSVMFAVMGLKGSGAVLPALNALHEQQDIFSYGVSDNPDGIALYVPGKSTGVLVTGTPTKTRLPPPFNQVPSIGHYHQIHHKFIICGFNGDDPVV
ncbi:MAG TPA: phospholipase D-like domain-containing protein, partial [Solirubrobacteraceae bacterium]|nr:phospholipase D-like domain-containing protein [Solirubrobacteraceae bacterium]